MKNIAIIGGSFNPPTTCHEAIAVACLERPEFDGVWLMPSGDRLDKNQSIEDIHRLGMLSLLQEGINDARLIVSNFELGLPRPNQTIKTLGALASAYPSIKPTFVFGADSYWNMPNWPDGVILQKNLDMLLVPRSGYPQPVAPNVDTLEIDEKFRSISSTEVRARVAARKPINGLVPGRVETYIYEHELYTTIDLDVSTPEITQQFARAPIYKKNVLVKARPAKKGEAIITTLADGTVETTNIAKSDKDMIVTNPSGEMYIVGPDKFWARHELTGEDGVYRATGMIRAIDNPSGSKIKITAPWGEEQIGNSDCKLAATFDPNEPDEVSDNRYIIGGKEFQETYILFNEA